MSHSLPMVFHTADLPFKDRVMAYKDDILGCCKPDEVAARFAKYVAQNVEASGWPAVWRSTPTSSGHHQPFDVVVEVSNVHASSLTAEVTITEPLVSDCLSLLHLESVNKFLSSCCNAVPLAELYPVYDESGIQDETALAIEHVRFFYENVWREWDEDEDGDYSFTGRHLETRLQLHYDIQDGNLPNDLVKKYKATYEQYRQKLTALKSLQEQMADFEQELDDMDVLQCAQISEECESLVHSLQIMENPQMRYLLASVSPTVAGRVSKGCRTAEGEEPVTFIVAPKLQAGMVKSLADNTIIEHCSCLGKALNGYYKGDTILVHPGKYGLEGVYRLTDPVHITGEGNCTDIIVSCSDAEDFTLECSASDITIKNICFEQSEGNDSGGIITAKNGQLTLEECDLKCITSGLRVERNAEVIMRECKVHGAKSAGIVVSCGATVCLENNKLFDNGEISKDPDQPGPVTGAILLEARSDSTKPLKATVVDNRISNNYCYGVCINKDKATFSASDNPEHGVKLEMSGNVFEHNTDGAIGHVVVNTS